MPGMMPGMMGPQGMPGMMPGMPPGMMPGMHPGMMGPQGMMGPPGMGQRAVLEERPDKPKIPEKAVLDTTKTLLKLDASLHKMAQEGLPANPIIPPGKQPEHAVEILYQHFKQMKSRKGGPVMKKKKGAQPGLDSEEWVTMLDNAIAENENIQMGEGAIEEAPKELYTVPTQSLAIPQIMKVFDEEIRDDEQEWVDPYLYQITFGDEATHPLGLELDWTTFPPVVKML